MQNAPSSAQKRMVPVILSGGSGTRLWPLSRSNYPKQFINLIDTQSSLFQQTAERVRESARFAAPIIVCNHEHRFIVATQLHEIGIERFTILLEPCARNTAPALALAAFHAERDEQDAILLVLPSDHLVGEPAQFLDTVDQLPQLIARQPRLMTFGIHPLHPETGYGYIRYGNPIDGVKDAYEVERFVEKPDGATAEHYVESGEYAWNSGMFFFSSALYLDELKRHEPQAHAATQQAIALARADLDFIRIDEASFAASPSISIDYAVMERTTQAGVIKLDCAWNDVGSWENLWQAMPKDPHGNAVSGEVYALDTQNCYARSESAAIGLFGVKDLVVVATKDAVLVTRRDCSQDIRRLIDTIKSRKPELVAQHKRVYRPWGYFESIDDGIRHQVKRINVRPGARLSLQMHHHRAEHWVVVSGTAQVVVGDETRLYSENESVYIPLGSVHRVENPGKIDLDIIEVQTGSYFGEDDIIRLEDQYGRKT